MGFPWKQLAKVGIGVGGIFVPGLNSAIHVVEENLPDLKGPNKKAAALKIAMSVIETSEDAAAKDLVNDPVVLAAASAYVDAYVALQNAIAASKPNFKAPPQPN